jgi:hypothetical protein
VKTLFSSLLLFIFMGGILFSQSVDTLLYKQVDTTTLYFEYNKQTVWEADRFLVSLGYLGKEPFVQIKQTGNA